MIIGRLVDSALVTESGTLVLFGGIFDLFS